MSLRRVPFYRALWRRQLVLGAERELALMLTTIAVVLPLHGLNFPSFVIGGLLWTVLMPAFRWLAKRDPQFSKVYVRHLRYRSFYSARSRPYRKI